MKMCFSVGMLCLFSVIASNGQTAAKSVFAELGGPGFASINFETRFQNKDGGPGGRIGIGGFQLDNDKFIALPVALNYLIPTGYGNFFEVGAGYTHLLATFDYNPPLDDVLHHSFGHVNLGYRLQPKDYRLHFRIALTPVFGFTGIVPFYGALSVGYQF